MLLLYSLQYDTVDGCNCTSIVINVSVVSHIFQIVYDSKEYIVFCWPERGSSIFMNLIVPFLIISCSGCLYLFLRGLELSTG